MTHTDRIKNIHGIAMGLAPSLQRYDFSDKAKQKQDWAELTYECAEAFWNHIGPKFEEAIAKDQAEVKAIQEKAKADALAAEQKKADEHSPEAVQAAIDKDKQGVIS